MEIGIAFDYLPAILSFKQDNFPQFSNFEFEFLLDNCVY